VSQFQCAGHPLRPATDHCLGEPLPHQLANRARAPPSTPYGLSPRTEIQGMLCGISFGFPKLFPIEGQDCPRVTHPCPCAIRIATARALDLHVLSTPPAFVLSQDQTLV